MKELIIKMTSVIATQASSDNATESILGRLYCIEYRPGTMDTGTDLTITCADGSVSNTLLIKTDAGTDNTWYYPRDLVHAVANGAALTGTNGGDRECPILRGIINVAGAQCGATTVRTGTVIIYWEPL